MSFRYFVGTLLYLMTTGFCWARYVALLVDIIGPGGHDASTWYSLLVAAGSIPLAYMTWLDGWGFHAFGTHGLLWMDAAGNLVVFVVVVSAFAALGLRHRQDSNPHREH